MRKITLFILCLLPAITACQKKQPITLYKSNMDVAERKRREATGYTAEEINKLIPNKTVLFVGMNPRNQIEYYRPDGQAFLWYPGNGAAVQSKWYTEGNNRICFVYPSASYNPSTNEYGGQPECKSLATWQGNAADSVDGDIFKLSTGQIPHVLDKAIFYKNLNEVVTKTGFDYRTFKRGETKL